MHQYQQDAQRTVSDSFHPHHIPAHALAFMIYRVLKHGAHIDVAKKSLFYGREPSASTADLIACSIPLPLPLEHEDIQITHTILGIFSEAAELLELLYRSINSGEPVSRMKMINEMGDILWYLALGFEHMGTNFEEVGAANIAKLRARYPEKFVDQFVRDEKKEEEKMGEYISPLVG